MIRLLSILTIILAIILFPPAALALVSNNAVPGDSTYPIKRFLEDGIYAVASLNSVSKAWFSAARSDRRYKEIKILVTSGKQAKATLQELVSQADITVEQMKQVTDKTQRKQLLNDYVQTLNKYEENLKQLSSDVASSPQISITPTPFPTPTAVPTVKPQPASAQPTPTSVPTRTPTPTPTLIPTPTSVQQPQVSPEPVNSNPPVSLTSPTDLNNAVDELEKIEDKATAASLLSVDTAPLPTPTPTPTKKSRTTVNFFSDSSPTPTPENSAVVTPTPPENSPSPTPAACPSPAISLELKYDVNTKTVSWTAAANAAYYNIRLVNPDKIQFNFDNDTNTWYTFPDNAISLSGSYSWWVDAVNDCGISRAASTFNLP